jgi:hypothetical protein
MLCERAREHLPGRVAAKERFAALLDEQSML